MSCARAVPTNHLMPAASSLTRTVATRPRVDVPERLSGRTPQQPARRAPHPHHVAGPRPWTQISLGAGTPNSGARTPHFTPPEAAHDLKHHRVLVAPPNSMRSTLSTSRSFVLAALRALHLDRRLRSTTTSHGRQRGTKERKIHALHHLYGGPQHR